MQIMFDYLEHFSDEPLVCHHLVSFSKTDSAVGSSSDSAASIFMKTQKLL